MSQWKADKRLHMIYGESVSFEELVKNLRDLNERIRNNMFAK